jgi:uncharacterized protein YfiM (DUF2279 family)
MADDKWTGEDKTLHFGVGGVIGASVTSFCMLRGKMIWWKAALVGTGAATFVGTIKELMDSSNTGFSYKDLAWTAGGGAVGSLGAVAFWTFDGNGNNWKFMGAQQ